MENKKLPIGTVVQLQGADSCVMIGGYLPITDADTENEKIWDYSGFRFPIGYVRNDEIYCFDHSQIEVIYAWGYQDIEEDRFIHELSGMEKELRTKRSEHHG